VSCDEVRTNEASRRTIFPVRLSSLDSKRIADFFRRETVSGVLLVVTAVIAMLWANSAWSEGYVALRDFRIGVAQWGLELSLGKWATDGLLAIFFFVVGLELKREFVIGSLRHVRTAIIPIAAAVGGVIVPALIFIAIVGADASLVRGWAIPTATDIAFAIAVIAIFGAHLPGSLRIFLLTLAVMDDLIAIGIIAVFYTETINWTALLLSGLVIVVYGVVAQLLRGLFDRRAIAAWLILLPLGMLAWAFMHASGIHATIAGVLLGFAIPVRHRRSHRHDDNAHGLAEQFENRFRPLSTAVALPVFAFFAAGVSIGGADGMIAAFSDPLAIAIICALVIGKPVGILSTTWLTITLARLRLDPDLRWVDLFGVALLAGVGFTVSLLVAELSFSPNGTEHNHAKVAIFAGSMIAALGASVLLSVRNRHYRRSELRSSEIQSA
jgi:NhaA family Na+:H+ antiporter